MAKPVLQALSDRIANIVRSTGLAWILAIALVFGLASSGRSLPSVYSSERLSHLGLSICYDVCLPEPYRHLSEKRAEVLADAGDEPGVAIAAVDRSLQQQVRQQMPSLQHRVFA